MSHDDDDDEHISRITCAIFTIFCRLTTAVAGSSFNGVTKSKGGRGNFGGFLPHRQCIIQHSIWDPHKKTEQIEMPLGLMTRVGPRYHVFDGNPIPKGRGNFWGKPSGPF